MNTTMVAMKNSMIDMVDNCSDEGLAKTCVEIITSIHMTSGLWLESGYGYKAVEICDRMYSQCTEVIENGGHYTYIRKLKAVRASCSLLSGQMFKEHQKTMYGVQKTSYVNLDR